MSHFAYVVCPISHPALVSFLFMPSLYSPFLICKIFYLLVSFLFLLSYDTVCNLAKPAKKLEYLEALTLYILALLGQCANAIGYRHALHYCERPGKNGKGSHRLSVNACMQMFTLVLAA